MFAENAKIYLQYSISNERNQTDIREIYLQPSPDCNGILLFFFFKKIKDRVKSRK